MNNPVMDELLEILRSMNERMKQLQRDQTAAVDKISRKVKDYNEILRGVGEVVGRRQDVPAADLEAA